MIKILMFTQHLQLQQTKIMFIKAQRDIYYIYTFKFNHNKQFPYNLSNSETETCYFGNGVMDDREDYLRKIIGQGRSPKYTRVGEIMTQEVISLFPNFLFLSLSLNPLKPFPF